MDIRIRQLEYFLALAKHLNFGRTARELNMTQPTLSFQIKSLENSLEVRLFHRTHRRVQLTSEGTRLKAHAHAILEQVKHALIDVRGDSSVRLTIACSEMGQYTLLPKILKHLRLRNTAIELDVLMLSPEAMKVAVLEGTVDALLMTPNWKLRGTEFTLLHVETLSAVLPANHLAVRRGSVSLFEFVKSPVLVGTTKDYAEHRDFVESLLLQHGLKVELIETPLETGIVGAMVAANRGVAFTSECLAPSAFPGVRVVPFDRPVHDTVLGLTWRKDNSSGALQAFHEVVREVAGRQNGISIPFPRTPYPVMPGHSPAVNLR